MRRHLFRLNRCAQCCDSYGTFSPRALRRFPRIRTSSSFHTDTDGVTRPFSRALLEKDAGDLSDAAASGELTPITNITRRRLQFFRD